MTAVSENAFTRTLKLSHILSVEDARSTRARSTGGLVKEYIIIMSNGRTGYVYADSKRGKMKLDPMDQGFFVFHKNNGCFRGRTEVFRIAGHMVVSLTEHEIPEGLELAPRYGGWYNRQVQNPLPAG